MRPRVSSFPSDVQPPDFLAGTGVWLPTPCGIGAKGDHLADSSHLGNERLCVTQA